MGSATVEVAPERSISLPQPSLPSTTIYSAVIFLGAFLLFQVQLIVGKYLLPWFGGTTGVWATCLLFFQLLLLAGYAYAHWLSSRKQGPEGARIHRTLVAFSLVVMVLAAFFWRSPITPGDSWKPLANAAPLTSILWLLAVSVGLHFFLLSTTGPLIQRWFANNNPTSSPYRLYALSNLGSLLGLLTYPFVFEPTLRLSTQAWIWCAAYVVYAAGVVICSRFAASPSTSSSTIAKPSDDSEPAPDRKRFLSWVGLTACASTMLLAVTQTICQDVSVVPLLWVLPLCVYLISFIICFEHERWYKRGFFHLLLAATLVGSLFMQRELWVSLLPMTGFYLLLLFACCMFCHGEVYRSRPAPRYLTSFYLSVSIGGALGGIFVNLIAPLIFRGFWELQLGLFACFGAMIWMVWADKRSWASRYVVWLPVAILLWGFWTAQYITNFSYTRAIDYFASWRSQVPLGLAILVSLIAAIQLRRRGADTTAPNSGKFRVNVPRLMKVCLLLAVVFAGAELALLAAAKYRLSLWSNRNFYGVLYVAEVETVDPHFNANILSHGRVRHGLQFRAPDLRRVPTAYFRISSGIGLMMLNHPRHKSQPAIPMRIGVIGLGIGTLAVYGRPGDVFRFYEINPAVIEIAADSPYFTYLRDSVATVQVVQGDARISLESELKAGQPQQYDLLIMDAFNGDSIPVHLLTEEAFEVYLKHLRGPDSVMAVQVSNRMLNLAPLVVRLARRFDMNFVYVDAPSQGGLWERSQWMLLSHNKRILEDPAIMRVASPLPGKEAPLWTDQYSSLLRLF